MHVTSAAVAACVLTAIGAAGAAQAHPIQSEWESGRRDLPPVSGTIRLGSGPYSRPGHVHHHWLTASPHRSYRHHYGPIYGYQGGAYAQLWRGSYNSAGSEAFWNRNVEFYGEGNDTLALTVEGVGANGFYHSRRAVYRVKAEETQSPRRLASVYELDSVAHSRPETGWGTADSATTGGAYPPPAPWHAASRPRVIYGDTGLWSGTGAASHAYPPTGGLAYYSSSSSAGPGGSPGGLGIYSSGSYGPGPRVIETGDGTVRSNGGPHIIELDRE